MLFLCPLLKRNHNSSFPENSDGSQLSYWGHHGAVLMHACLSKASRTFVSGDSLNCQVKNLAEEEWNLLWELCAEMLVMESSYLQRWERILVLQGFSPHPRPALFCFQSYCLMAKKSICLTETAREAPGGWWLKLQCSCFCTLSVEEDLAAAWSWRRRVTDRWSG